MSAPICMSPVAIRSAPNQTAAALDRFTVSITVGNMNAISRPVRNAVSVELVVRGLEPVGLGRFSRTNARTTRMPVICSRRIWFTRSIRVCISVN